ncbi:MAG: hypothetical protein OXC62_06300 [Aestuariivita sp.]|nr:hypothetical protein [Aestuariivita sp.]
MREHQVQRWVMARNMPQVFVSVMVLCGMFFWSPLTLAQEGTLGIDCDKPRTNAEGKLILGDDGSYRAICEANRSTALHYVNLVTETRDRLQRALTTLPPPIWDSLVTHLTTTDTLATWRYTDSTVMTPLQTLFPNRSAVAAGWAQGIFEGSSIAPSWQAQLRARASGSDFDDVIVIWLDPAAVRDRWTPEMIQRTARAWIEQQEGQRVVGHRLPRIMTATDQLKDMDGLFADISPDPTINAVFASVPTNALVMRLGVHRRIKQGSVRERCADATEIGFRRLSWERRNGIYVVPDTALLADGTNHPQRGEPLLGLNGLPGVNESNEADGRFLTHSTCRAPRTLDAVRTVDCPARLAGQDVQGKHVRTFRFREVQNDPSELWRIDMVPVGPGNGELGTIAPSGAPHPVWTETTLFCEADAIPDSDAPDIPDPAEDSWTFPDCRTEWGGQFNRGDRYGYRRTITYPPGWPVEDVEVRHIDDYCFNLTWATGTQYRPGPACPAGHTGAIIEGRDLRWQDREWAINKTPTEREGWDKKLSETPWQRTLIDLSDPDNSSHMDAVGAAYDAGLTGLDQVLRITDWRVVITNCAAPVAASDTQTRDGGACPAGEVGEITEGRSFSWYNPGTPTPACGTLPEAGRLLCTSVSAQQSPVPVSRSVDAAAAAYDAGPTSTSWWDAVTLSRDWHEISNTCREPPSEWGEGYTDNDNDGVSAGIDSDDSDPSVGNENGNTVF